MTPVSIGDLASNLSMRLETSRVKSDIDTLSLELSSGRHSDVGKQQGGDYSRISALERSIDIGERYRSANSDTTLKLDVAQQSLESIQSSVSRSASQFLTASSDQSAVSYSAAAEIAEQELQSVISALNTQVSGIAIFGGTNTQTQPLESADVLISSLTTVISGAGTVADALNAIDAWFSDSVSGFDATMYNGEPSENLQLPSSSGSELSYEIKANDPALIDTLKALSIAVLAKSPSFGADVESQKALIETSAEQLLEAEYKISDVRGSVGVLQEAAFQDSIEIAAEIDALNMALNNIYSVDPYETASKLDAATLQLEAIYTITARISDLSLTRYL